MGFETRRYFFHRKVRATNGYFADKKGRFTDEKPPLTKKPKMRCNLCSPFYILQTKQWTIHAIAGNMK